MEEKDLERIERYLRQEMPATERAAFEQELSGDSALQREVELHAFALKAIRLEGRAALKARLRQRQMHLPDREKSGSRLWFWAAVLLGVALVAVFVWRLSQPSPSPGSSPNSLPDSPPVVSPPTPEGEQQPPASPADTPKIATQPQPAPPVAASKPDLEKLFAANFQAYVDEDFKSVLRSGARTQALPPYEQFVDYYLKGEHGKALAIFEQLNPAVKNSDNLLFFKANSLLATGKADEAAALLKGIVERNQSSHVAQAKWYLALSWLKTGEMKETENQLNSIASDTSSPRQKQAKDLLKKLTSRN